MNVGRAGSGVLCGLVLALLLSACGEPAFRKARKAERLGRYPTAIALYDAFVKESSGSARVPEAVYRSAEIYRARVKDYPQARARYLQLAGQSAGSSWGALAEDALMNCPDYFPYSPEMVPVFGDSQSGGLYMRKEERVRPVKDVAGRFKVEERIFAGKKEIKKSEQVFEKRDRKLTEFSFEGRPPVLLMKFPIEKSARWETERAGHKVRFIVEDESASVQVRAGTFERCLKVREENPETPDSWRTLYYAPDTGLVLICISTLNTETRILELLERLPAKEAGKKKR